uniref:Uncharacterized protein n=1 Tax=Cercocebus atys TaxID=9531 RepID=A0A2K5M5Y3_CERAT
MGETTVSREQKGGCMVRLHQRHFAFMNTQPSSLNPIVCPGKHSKNISLRGKDYKEATSSLCTGEKEGPSVDYFSI